MGFGNAGRLEPGRNTFQNYIRSLKWIFRDFPVSRDASYEGCIMFINESIYPVDVFDQYIGDVLACSVLGTHDNEFRTCFY